MKHAPLPGHVAVQEKPVPAPGPGEVRIKVQASAVCGSDLTAYRYPPHYHGFMQVPVILGHEVAGIVDEVGPLVEHFRTGEPVLMESNRYCGTCPHCLQGHTTSCEKAQIAGLQFDGGMAEYVVAREKILHRIPDGLSYRNATVAQPLSVVLHGLVDHIRMPAGGTAVVIGPGIIGNLAAQAARALGCPKIIVAGIDADEDIRLPVARRLGFETANIQRNLDPILSKHDRAGGFPLVIECSGGYGSFSKAVELLAKRGQLLLLGIHKKNDEIDINTIVRREISLYGSYTSNWSNYEQALSFIGSSVLNIDLVVTEYSLNDGVCAFEDALAARVMKPVLFP